MIQKYIDAWRDNNVWLADYLKKTPQREYDDYSELLRLTIFLVLNRSEEGRALDPDGIEKIDFGDYQGTLIFVIPMDCYQPDETETVTTWVNYGSCSGCDTLLAISEYVGDIPTEEQVKKYMTLCLHMVEHMRYVETPEIVYCKDCKHKWVDSCYYMDDVDDNGFCHHGERR